MSTSEHLRKSHGIELVGDAVISNMALETRAIDGTERVGNLFIDSATGIATVALSDGNGGINCVPLDAAALVQLVADLASLTGRVEILESKVAALENAGA